MTLPPVLDVSAAAALRTCLLEATSPGTTIRIDSGAVDAVSTAGIQMLLAAAEYVRRSEAKLLLAKPTEALVEGFADLGLFAELMAWNVES